MNSLPAPRAARPGDAPELARLHVQAWAETYAGLLPEAEIAARTEGRRRAQWTQALAMEETRIALIPGVSRDNLDERCASIWMRLYVAVSESVSA